MFYVTEVAKKHNIPFAIFFAILVFWITPALPRVFHLTHLRPSSGPKTGPKRVVSEDFEFYVERRRRLTFIGVPSRTSVFLTRVIPFLRWGVSAVAPRDK
jgi:hypothetical protein